MKAATSFQSFILRYFSQPRHYRKLYQYLSSHAGLRVVQIGIGNAQATQLIVSMMLRNSHKSRPRFAGIDLFEGRPSAKPGVSLKEAHRILHHEALDVRLLPGEPAHALTRFANDLRGTDLVIVAADQQALMNQAWHLIARFLHKDSQVWVEETNARGQQSFRVLDPAQVRALVPVKKGRAA